METTLTDYDFQLAEVRFLVPLINEADLITVAQFVQPDHSVDQLEEWQLREYILTAAENLYTQNPEHLQALLDEIGRLGGKRAEKVVRG